MVDDGFPFFSSFGIYYSRLWLPIQLDPIVKIERHRVSMHTHVTSTIDLYSLELYGSMLTLDPIVSLFNQRVVSLQIAKGELSGLPEFVRFIKVVEMQKAKGAIDTYM